MSTEHPQHDPADHEPAANDATGNGAAANPAAANGPAAGDPATIDAASTGAAATEPATTDPAGQGFASDTPDIDPHTIAAIEEALSAEHEQATVVDPLLREFRRAATDCDLPLAVDRVQEVDGAFRVHFESLSWAQMRRLVNVLRDIADDRPVQVVAGPAGPGMFDVPAPAGPVPAPGTGNGLHIEVPA